MTPHPIPPIHAWAVVPANGQPVLCIDHTRAEQIAPAMHGVIVELSNKPAPMTDLQIDALVIKFWARRGEHDSSPAAIVRAVEAAHGITS